MYAASKSKYIAPGQKVNITIKEEVMVETLKDWGAEKLGWREAEVARFLSVITKTILLSADSFDNKYGPVNNSHRIDENYHVIEQLSSCDTREDHFLLA